MNDEKNRNTEKKPGEGTGTLTLTEAEELTHEQPEEVTPALSPEEEKVIRMLYGKSLKGHEALEFAPGASMETRLQLALIEASLLEAFQAGALDPDPATGAPRSVLTDKFDGD